MKKIYLASSSPRRKQLLEQIGLEVEVIKFDYEEDMTLDMSPTELVEHLSFGKAKAASTNVSDGIIISADTIAVFGDERLGKPMTEDKAKLMLQKLNGNMIDSITGFSIIDTETNKHISRAVTTKVYFKKLSDKEIDNYIKIGDILDKAGAFGIQGIGAITIKKIEGDYNTIIGLPLFALAEELAKFGIKIL